jgi:hypothetical protein
MQTDAQNAPHAPKRKPLAHWFKLGRSGNPGGKSRAQLRYEAFLELFEATHHRKPNAVETALLKNAGACAARAEGRKVTAEHVVRTGRLLQSLLVTLGLSGGAPSKGEGTFPGHGLAGKDAP